ncbi:MAG: PKD domain-containing protein [Alphaproteobacteria bacterium]|nr:PKD domain-containing protein [Alphaproteobacteria bacterium]
MRRRLLWSSLALAACNQGARPRELATCDTDCTQQADSDTDGLDTDTPTDSGDTGPVDTGRANTPPVAVFEPFRGDLFMNDTITLDGASSYDPDGDDLTFAWEVTAWPAGANTGILNPDGSLANIFLDREGAFTIRLTVDDGRATDAISRDLTVLAANNRPIANAGLDQTVAVGTTVHLSGAGSHDPDGDPLTYHWTVTGPSAPVTLSGVSNPATAVSPSFLATESGSYTATLTVHDGRASSAPDTMTVQAK